VQVEVPWRVIPELFRIGSGLVVVQAGGGDEFLSPGVVSERCPNLHPVRHDRLSDAGATQDSRMPGQEIENHIAMSFKMKIRQG
jgi:hypothetical protein